MTPWRSRPQALPDRSRPLELARTYAVCVAVALAGCTSSPPFEAGPGCQPLLDGVECFWPFPSNFFRVAPATGPEVRVEGDARVFSSRTGGPVLPNLRRPRPADGFSVMSPIALRLGGALSTTGLVTVLADPAPTRAATSPTLIVDAETRALVPHFVDVDDRDPDPATRALILRPLAPLAFGRRYVVAIRDVRGPSGDLVPAPEGFARIRDARGLDTAPLTEIAARFEADVFPPLAAVGVERGDLQLAFDLTTRTQGDVEADLLRVRALTLAWLESQPSRVTIDAVREDSSPRIWRTVEGRFRAPLFLDRNAPSAALSRDSDGLVAQNGTLDVPFTAQIPVALVARFGPGRALGYGHGFFGGRDELSAPSTEAIANAAGAVVFGLDWLGMTREDVLNVIDDLVNQPTESMRFSERVHQAMANWIVLGHLVDRGLAEEPALRRPTTPGARGTQTSTSGRSNAGDALYARGPLGFVGISQGHILGGVQAALNPALGRVVLEAGGAGYASLMARARPFAPFLVFAAQSVERPSEQLKFLLYSQLALDPIDPGCWAPRLIADPLPGARSLQVLLRLGLGDSQVPNDGTLRHARALGLPAIEPLPAIGKPLGLDTAPAPHVGAGLAVFDFGLELAPIYGRAEAPAEENSVHERLRATPEALRQLARFLDDGTIENPCAPDACRLRP